MSGRASHRRPRDARDRLIVALDAPSAPEAEAMVARLGGSVAFYKVGLELAFAGGLDLVPRLAGAGCCMPAPGVPGRAAVGCSVVERCMGAAVPGAVLVVAGAS